MWTHVHDSISSYKPWGYWVLLLELGATGETVALPVLWEARSCLTYDHSTPTFSTHSEEPQLWSQPKCHLCWMSPSLSSTTKICLELQAQFLKWWISLEVPGHYTHNWFETKPSLLCQILSLLIQFHIVLVSLNSTAPQLLWPRTQESLRFLLHPHIPHPLSLSAFIFVYCAHWFISKCVLSSLCRECLLV